MNTSSSHLRTAVPGRLLRPSLLLAAVFATTLCATWSRAATLPASPASLQINPDHPAGPPIAPLPAPAPPPPPPPPRYGRVRMHIVQDGHSVRNARVKVEQENSGHRPFQGRTDAHGDIRARVMPGSAKVTVLRGKSTSTGNVEFNGSGRTVKVEVAPS